MNNQRINMTRRDALRLGALAVAGTVMGTVNAEESPTMKMPDSEWSRLRGFNYQPSYGSTGFELWQRFNAKVIAEELAQGKRYFPQMNALRWWQSWDSFLRDPKQYARNFETTLQLAADVGCKVMPCLFNRWHDAVLDYGGIYIDHFLPKASWVQSSKMFDSYLAALVGGHKDDPRILAWDICNEPYWYPCPCESIPDVFKAETAWLKTMYDKCKGLGAKAPTTVSVINASHLEMSNPICDVLSFHPYWRHDSPKAKKADFEKDLDLCVAFALKVGKPLIVTECCWGSTDDKVRADSVRYTLTQLKARNIGWLVYLLHHSLIADAHRLEYGPLGSPGNLSFIEADGSLRRGHQVFNDFAQ